CRPPVDVVAAAADDLNLLALLPLPLLIRRRPPRSPLFPYTTLFRSAVRRALRQARAKQQGVSDETGKTALPVRLAAGDRPTGDRSEEHTSELQSRFDLVCRLLLEKKKERCLPTPARGTRGTSRRCAG